MTEVITYVPNLHFFLEELTTEYPQFAMVDDDRKVTYTPLHQVRAKNENGSLAIAMLTDEQLAAVNEATTIESLGWYDTLFDDADALAKYKSVYPYDEPVEYTDEEGNVVQYMRSKKIGVFA